MAESEKIAPSVDRRGSPTNQAERMKLLRLFDRVAEDVLRAGFHGTVSFRAHVRDGQLQGWSRGLEENPTR